MTENDSPPHGVSVAICCHNSASRLPETLAHLNRQEVPYDVVWEVLIIDNGSTDGSAHVAESLWVPINNVKFRVLREENIGLVNARICAFNNCAYPVISFVDDDNWVSPNWVKNISRIFSNYASIGACGSLNEPVFEVSPPSWFNQFARSYAVGPQGKSTSDIDETVDVLFGAGLSIRISAWEELVRGGFHFRLMGRSGDTLLCGEDYELCLALQLAGWQIAYSPKLRLKHYLPENRLNWQYLRRMIRGAGYADLLLEPYYAYKQRRPVVPWQKFLLINMLRILRRLNKLVFRSSSGNEGDAEILAVERASGRINAALDLHEKYQGLVKDIQSSNWNKVEHDR